MFSWSRGIATSSGRVRHRVVANLGRKEELKASGQLEKLAGSFARLDPPLVGTRREVGALLLAWHFLRELDVVGDDRPLAAALGALGAVGRRGRARAGGQPVVLALAVV